MTMHLDELELLASHEPVSTGTPDVGAIRRRGRRLRTRRRVVTGLASLGVVAVVAAPVAAFVSDGAGPPAPSAPATGALGDQAWSYTVNPMPRLPADIPDGCGSLLGCLDEAVPETGEIVSEPWAIGAFGDGTVGGTVDEVIYAVRPSPGEPVGLAVGFQDGEGLHRLELAFRPDPQDADDADVQVVGGVRRLVDGAPQFLMVGLVEEDPVTDVAWQTEPGTWQRAPLNDDLVEGYGVFWLVGAWSSAWSAVDPAPVTLRVDGREYAP